MRLTSHYSLLLLPIILLGLLSACEEEGADERPGLWTALDLIETYPGDTVLVMGQVSNYIGLDRVTLSLPAWGIDQTYCLDGKHSRVFNFNYRLPVPADATFGQELLVTVTDIEGTENKKNISLKYLPDTEAPKALDKTGLNELEQTIEVSYDTELHQGIFTPSMTFTDDRSLRDVTIQIPALGITDVLPLSGRSAKVDRSYLFAEAGTYDLTITVSDQEGNQTTYMPRLLVMLEETVDPVEDYDRLYAFMAGDEQPDDYLYGYYLYMQRMDAYCYQCAVYAPSDETEFFFSPTCEVNGERRYGISPYISGKVISHQEDPTYAQGFRPGKGYWGFWVDLQNQTITTWALDESAGDASTLYYSADWNGWGFTEMQAGATPYQKVSDVTIWVGNLYFCFATATDWTNVWRTWDDAGQVAGWWFSEDGTGNGATLPTITQDVEARITFDTLIKWCYIKKIKN